MVMGLMFQKVCGTEPLMQVGDCRLVKFAVRVDDVRVVDFKPGHIGRSRRAVLAGYDQTVTTAPTRMTLGKDSVQYNVCMPPIFNKVRDADGRSHKPYMCLQSIGPW